MQRAYFPQLDGLRAIAIMLVIVYHWFPEGTGVNAIANGPVGVTLFFVLSGFLISNILLKARETAGSAGTFAIYKAFLIRRLLRIVPLYYLVLFLVWQSQYMKGIPTINTDLYSYPFYYLFYLSNFLIVKQHNWSDILSPFWSLAVEEQFYLLWPLLLLTVRYTYIKHVLVGIIFLGVLSRVILAASGFDEGVLMPTCLDAFGAGGLWAFVLFYDKSPGDFLKLLNIAAVGACLLFIWFSVQSYGNLFLTLFFRPSMSVVCLFLVAHASYRRGLGSIVGKILSAGAFRYIGKISYGLYVFHMLVPAVLMPLLMKMIHRLTGIPIFMSEPVSKFISLLMLLIVASLSWYFFEAPFNRLKGYFELPSFRQVRADAPTRFKTTSKTF